MLSVSSEYQHSQQSSNFHDDRKGTEKKKEMTFQINCDLLNIFIIN